MQTETLAGIKVLELGSMVAAPFAAHMLGQLGAEVIKLEPVSGDPTRTLVRGGPSGTFIAYSRGKKSIAVDLSTEEGHDLFARLLADVDVLIHNLAPNAAQRLNVTYEDCSRIKPDLIYCHIRGYGPGPLENELASNPVAEASTGVMYSHRNDGRPTRLGPSYHDQFAGTYAVIGILAALLRGDRATPEERHMEIGLYETGLHVAGRDYVGMQLKKHLTGRADVEPSGEFSMPGYGAYETADGRWVYLMMLNDNHWKKFCESLSLAVAGDESLATFRMRRKRRAEVEEIVAQAIASFTFDQLTERLSGTGFAFTEIVAPQDVLSSPQARHPGKLTALTFQDLAFDVPDFPLRDRSEATELPPPVLGAHTLEIMQSLGYDKADYQRLLDANVLADPAADRTWHRS
ncbi:CaiB/BaiF CoA transferase family protein [Shinella sp.]|uniref:CaiB/BaiF CoA transferase family protein n=1 Tax=Shinella sp. TaxID=1870904 RepID=UPI003F71483C